MSNLLLRSTESGSRANSVKRLDNLRPVISEEELILHRTFETKFKEGLTHPCDGCSARARTIRDSTIYDERIIVRYDICDHVREYVLPGHRVNDLAIIPNYHKGFRIKYTN